MAASSEVEIANAALIKLGADRITLLTDDTHHARLARERYYKVRDKLLRSHPWNFAVRRVELGQLDSEPEYEYSYEFQLPDDCLRVLDTNNLDDTPYKIEGRKLLCNQSSIKIKYISKVEDVSQYDDFFIEALATGLASDLAYAITNSTTVAQLMREDHQRALSEARTYDAQEGSVERIEAEYWRNSRY